MQEAKLKYYLLSKHKLDSKEMCVNSDSYGQIYIYLRLFPSNEENISFKVILMLLLEQIIIAKDIRSVEKLIEYATIYSGYKLD
jgi:hypothetical protein